ncbi:unnamed protein product [Gongylonema pulchrum]|uniref:ANK_REP_REGION domain-containing protein n=1 Tax=Gongylonema pulchrum TaxID=637853 RepID=A0A183D7R5_9BILA|nr:unnamed protein product [Gongylonema pulchrum]
MDSLTVNDLVILLNKIGDTALHAASWKGHLDCVKTLLEHGANALVHNNERKQPIDVASDPQIRALIKLSMCRAMEKTEVQNSEYLSESESGSDPESVNDQ